MKKKYNPKKLPEFREWLNTFTVPQQKYIAEQVGVKLITLRALCYGLRRPGKKLATRLEEFTWGLFPRGYFRTDLWPDIVHQREEFLGIVYQKIITGHREQTEDKKPKKFVIKMPAQKESN